MQTQNQETATEENFVDQTVEETYTPHKEKEDNNMQTQNQETATEENFVDQAEPIVKISAEAWLAARRRQNERAAAAKTAQETSSERAARYRRWACKTLLDAGVTPPDSNAASCAAWQSSVDDLVAEYKRSERKARTKSDVQGLTVASLADLVGCKNTEANGTMAALQALGIVSRVRKVGLTNIFSLAHDADKRFADLCDCLKNL